IVCLGGMHSGRSSILPPPPMRDLGHIIAVAGDVVLMVDELVAHDLLGIRSPRAQLRQSVNNVVHQVKAIEMIQYTNVEGSRGGSLFLVAAHMYVVVACAPIGQSVNEPWIAMKCKDDWFVDRKKRVEVEV